MKNLILLFCLLLSYTIGGQSHEVQISYQKAIKKHGIGDGLALAYFHNFNPQAALGFKTNLNYYQSNDSHNIRRYTGSLDLVQRWNFIKNSKIRLMPEAGLSYLRRYEKRAQITDGCLYSYLGSDLIDTSINHLGWLMGLSADFSVLKFLNIGITYQHSIYVFNNMDHEDSRLHKAGFNFFTSLRL